MTAIEFLEHKLNKRLHHLSDHRVHIKEFVRTAKCAEIRKILEVIHQAKEMEKQQIVKAYEENMMSYTDGEVYYNEKYNKKRQSRD